MKAGFSISIDRQRVEVNSFLKKHYDDIYFQTENFDFLLEGVLLNKRHLLQQFALRDFETFIREIYLVKKEAVFTVFEGEFRGFIYDKIRNKLFVFTNITSTQRVYYLKAKDKILIDTDLKRLATALENLNLEVAPDMEAIYQMMCFTNMTEEKTPILGIKKLLDGHNLEVDLADENILEKQYFSVSAITKFSGNKSKGIDKIHDVFTASVLLEYDKDTEFKTNHLALLSGGLDSRVAMMYALENGRIPGNAFCFSQSNYFDHQISEKIAKDYDLHYEFVPLDGGQYLKKIDHLTEISEGMVLFTGGIHVQHAVDELRYKNFSLFHSGQIGDGVLGGFLSSPAPKKPSFFKIVVNESFLPKVENGLRNIMQKYESEELFLVRNVGFNRTVLGAHVLQQRAYQTSPFMTKDFLQVANSLPEKWKFQQQLYIEWINKHCKNAARYRWERTLMKPDATWKTLFGDKVVKRSHKIVVDKILKIPARGSMYPYQYYFDSQPDIQTVYTEYYENNRHRLENYPELGRDVHRLFNAGDFSSKSQAVNILAIFKLYF